MVRAAQALAWWWRNRRRAVRARESQSRVRQPAVRAKSVGGGGGGGGLCERERGRGSRSRAPACGANQLGGGGAGGGRAVCERETTCVRQSLEPPRGREARAARRRRADRHLEKGGVVRAIAWSAATSRSGTWLGSRPSGVTSDGRSRRFVCDSCVAQEHAGRARGCTRGCDEEGERRARSSVLVCVRTGGAASTG